MVGFWRKVYEDCNQRYGIVKHSCGCSEGRVEARMPVLSIGLRSVGTLHGLPARVL